MEFRSTHNALDKTDLDRRFTTKRLQQAKRCKWFCDCLKPFIKFYDMADLFAYYLNFRNESHKHGKLRDFWEKNLHRNRRVRPVLLCEEHRCMLVDFFYELDTKINLSSIIILWYINGLRPRHTMRQIAARYHSDKSPRLHCCCDKTLR